MLSSGRDSSTLCLWRQEPLPFFCRKFPLQNSGGQHRGCGAAPGTGSSYWGAALPTPHSIPGCTGGWRAEMKAMQAGTTSLFLSPPYFSPLDAPGAVFLRCVVVRLYRKAAAKLCLLPAPMHCPPLALSTFLISLLSVEGRHDPKNPSQLCPSSNLFCPPSPHAGHSPTSSVRAERRQPRALLCTASPVPCCREMGSC